MPLKSIFNSARARFGSQAQVIQRGGGGDMRWDPSLGDLLEQWGEGNAWLEIPLLLAPARGRVLDLGCGTGIVMRKLEGFSQIEVHGCDITEAFLERARARGIPPERLSRADARELKFKDDSFEYVYSIGALHFFSEADIPRVLSEARRVARHMVYFHIAVARSGKNEGRVSTYDEYFNNSAAWWVDHFRPVFSEVLSLDSSWQDDRSVGKWLIGVNQRP